MRGSGKIKNVMARANSFIKRVKCMVRNNYEWWANLLLYMHTP
jgi:hypothetical protein